MPIKVETEFRLVNHFGEEEFAIVDTATENFCGNPLMHGRVFETLADNVSARMRKLIDTQFGTNLSKPKIRVDGESYDIPVEEVISTFLSFMEDATGVKTPILEDRWSFSIQMFKTSKVFNDMIQKNKVK